jgi:hypothetical protein
MGSLLGNRTARRMEKSRSFVEDDIVLLRAIEERHERRAVRERIAYRFETSKRRSIGLLRENGKIAIFGSRINGAPERTAWHRSTKQ